METTYAAALWQALERGTEPAGALTRLKQLLAREGRLALLPKIGAALRRIAARSDAQTRVTLAVARKKDEASAREEVREVLKALGVEPKDLKTQVDDTLIGGWRLEGRGTLIDASYRRELLDIYQRSIA